MYTLDIRSSSCTQRFNLVATVEEIQKIFGLTKCVNNIRDLGDIYVFFVFFLRFKTAPQLLQSFSRMLQCYFNMKLQKCCVQSQNLTEGEQIMTKFTFLGESFL